MGRVRPRAERKSVDGLDVEFKFDEDFKGSRPGEVYGDVFEGDGPVEFSVDHEGAVFEEFVEGFVEVGEHIFSDEGFDDGEVFGRFDAVAATVLLFFDHFEGGGADVAVVVVVVDEAVEEEGTEGDFALVGIDADVAGDEVGVGGGDGCAHRVAGGVPPGVAEEAGGAAFFGEGGEEVRVGGAGPAEVGIGDGDGEALVGFEFEVGEEVFEGVGGRVGGVDVEGVVEGGTGAFELGSGVDNVVAEGLFDGGGFVGGDFAAALFVGVGDADGGAVFGEVAESVANEVIGDLVYARTERGFVGDFEAVDFFVDGGDFGDLGAERGGIVLAEDDAVEGSVVGHADEVGLDLDVSAPGGNVVVEAGFRDFLFVAADGGEGLGVGGLAVFFFGDGPVVELGAEGPCFIGGGGGDPHEGGEDVPRGVVAEFADAPEFAEAFTGEGVAAPVDAAGDESAVGDHVGTDDDGVVFVEVAVAEPEEEGFGGAGGEEPTEEFAGRGIDLDTGDGSDHLGELSDGGAVIDGDEEDLFGKVGGGAGLGGGG